MKTSQRPTTTKEIENNINEMNNVMANNILNSKNESFNFVVRKWNDDYFTAKKSPMIEYIVRPIYRDESHYDSTKSFVSCYEISIENDKFEGGEYTIKSLCASDPNDPDNLYGYTDNLETFLKLLIS
tara:strand:+ start:3202 stop:3582 length:381 start_codon:yes stop_codon:yes gene_type:complete